MKLSIFFYHTTGDSNTRLIYKFVNYELDYITRNPKEYITKIEVIIGDL